MTLPWLTERRENAQGLAAEFIGFFDEVRLHGQENLLLDPKAKDRVLEKTVPAEAEVVAEDLRRIHEVWDCYRRLVPRDSIDQLRDLARALDAKGVRGPAPELVMVAGDGLSKVLDEAGAPIVLLPPPAGKAVIGADGTIRQGETVAGKLGLAEFADEFDAGDLDAVLL